MSNLLKKEKGFTLIEIVLVLAIAGLLLVIVFLAVSGAQKSRRDSQRKNDLSRIAAQLENYASNTNGDYPTVANWGAFTTSNYISGANLKDPSTAGSYDFTVAAVAGATATVPAAVTTAAPTAQVTYAISGRTYQVCIGLEQGTSSCRDNK